MLRKRVKLQKPKPISEVFSEGTLGKKAGKYVRLYELQKGWGKIVGPELARRTCPKEFRKRTLVIAVENSAWAQHLSFMKENLLDLIEGKIGLLVDDLRFVNTILPRLKFEEKPAAEKIPENRNADKDEDLSVILKRLRAKSLELRALARRS